MIYWTRFLQHCAYPKRAPAVLVCGVFTGPCYKYQQTYLHCAQHFSILAMVRDILLHGIER